MSRSHPRILALLALVLTCASAADAQRSKRGSKPTADPYAGVVWPPPPDEARIKLDRIIHARADVEGESRLGRFLIGASPKNPWDELDKPQAVAFDPQGRILVSDWGAGAVIRIDLEGGAWDVLGVKGSYSLKKPLGLTVGSDGTIYVADSGLQQVISMSVDGSLLKVFGQPGELTNPTDVALSPDGKRLYVTDSRGHQVVVFDVATGQKVESFGSAGKGPGEFAFPTALAFREDGDLLVVDQINSRVQQLTARGDFVDQFGGLAVGFGSFVRPKDVAVDDVGFIYVTDFAFNNIQIFDVDFTLLTFVGGGGTTPGRFNGLSGVAVQGDRIAAVDQIGQRLHLLRWITAKTPD